MIAFKASVEVIILRFYLMMAVIIGSFLLGQPVLALISLPIFLSAMLGVKFNFKVLNFWSKKQPKSITYPNLEGFTERAI